MQLNERDRMEVELRELRRLSKERRLLETPATVFSREAPKDCHGDCEHPTLIGVMGMTCCNFWQTWELYNRALRLEQLQRQVVYHGTGKRRKGDEPRQIEGAPLKEAYERDFTATGVHRRRKDHKGH